MGFERFCELFPKAQFVKIIEFNDEELYDEDLRKKNKAPLNSLKDPLDVAQAKNWVGRGGRLGWIVPKGYIVIDIDNKDNPRSAEVTEEILKNRGIKYWANRTKQGVHFVFANVSEVMKGKGQFQGYLNHIAIQQDGRADAKGYIILPANDEKSGRSWYQWEGEAEDLPFWMRPLRPRREVDISFIDMTEGGGNELMFKLRGAHSGPNLITAEESVECLRIINWEIWTDPMPEEMLMATVARPLEKTYGNMMAQDGTGPGPKENQWRVLAEQISKDLNIIAVGDYIHQWNGTVYKRMTEHQIQSLIYHYNKDASKTQRGEVIEFLSIINQVEGKKLDTDDGGIPCANGYLDFYNLELREPDPSQYDTIKIDIEYHEHVEFSERIDEFMKSLCGGDETKMAMAYEMAGYALMRRNKFHKFFILLGTGGTGKSTFTNLIKRMFSAEQICPISLEQFDKDYYLATLVSAMVAIDDDASSQSLLKDAGRFKSIIAGEEILVRQIYDIPVKLISTATVFVNSNGMVKIGDRSDGLYRRMVIIEFNNIVKKPDRDFMTKITKLDMQYFFYKAVQGIHNVLRRGKFIMDTSEESLRQRFQVQQSSIFQWIHFCGITTGDLLKKPLQAVFQEFSTWCINAKYQGMSLGSFREMIVSTYKLHTVYDRGLQDQIIDRADTSNTFCPFDEGGK